MYTCIHMYVYVDTRVFIQASHRLGRHAFVEEELILGNVSDVCFGVGQEEARRCSRDYLDPKNT